MDNTLIIGHFRVIRRVITRVLYRYLYILKVFDIARVKSFTPIQPSIRLQMKAKYQVFFE